MLTNLAEKNELTENINRALRVMLSTILTELKKTPFELHHGREPRTANLFQHQTNRKSQSSWAEMRTEK